MTKHPVMQWTLGLLILTAVACGGKKTETAGGSAETGAQPAAQQDAQPASQAAIGTPAGTTPQADVAQPANTTDDYAATGHPEGDRDDFDKFVNDVQKGLTVAAQLKSIVKDAYKKRGTLPQTGNDLGAVPRAVPMEGVESVSFSQGKIVVAYKAHGNHPAGTIELTPAIEGSDIVWNCSGGSLADPYRPADCR
jgi:hypothetical protein